MTSWSHGYNISSGYTFGFYRETGPAWLDFCVAARGYATPRSAPDQAFRYLELGSGQGFGLCLLAAANPQGEFCGIDFSPEHTAHARTLASQLGLKNVVFLEGDFAELAEHWPSSLGSFDYAVLHGIYAWVSREIRHSLVSILKNTVVSGGLAYVSYNSMPGWASAFPLQHMLRQIERSGVARGVEAIKVGRELFTQLESLGSGVTRALPSLKGRIETTAKQPAAYLVQEYLHENWHPLWSSEVSGELSEAKLELVSSATIVENLLPSILPSEFRNFLAGHPSRDLQDDLSDCLINQTFRRDIFVRGPRRRFPGDRAWQSEFRIFRLRGTAEPEIEVSTSFGVIKLSQKETAPIFKALSDGSCLLGDLLGSAASQDGKQGLLRTLLLLMHGGWIGFGINSVVPNHAQHYNSIIAQLALEGAPYRHLVASKLNAAWSASDSDLLMLQLFVGASERFKERPVETVKETLDDLGRQIVRDGKALTGERLADEIRESTSRFISETIPLWKKLGVVE